MGASLVRKLCAGSEGICLTDPNVLRTLSRDDRAFAAGDMLVRSGGRCELLHVLRRGWACRFRQLGDGRRQIVDFVLPGEPAGLQEILLGRPCLPVVAISDGEARTLQAEGLRQLSRFNPALSEGLMWYVMRDESILAEHLVGVGRRTPRERLAHLFLELLQRARRAGLCTGNRLETPITVDLLADTLGLDRLSVGRALRELEGDGLTFVDGNVALKSPDELAAAVSFDPAYLCHAPGAPPAAAA